MISAYARIGHGAWLARPASDYCQLQTSILPILVNLEIIDGSQTQYMA